MDASVDSSLPASSLAGKRIVVVGAGIAGLAFVISLKNFWTDAMGKFPTIIHYERDEHQRSLREGYSISLHTDPLSAGVQVLQKMGVLDALLDVGITRKENKRAYLGMWSLGWRRFIEIHDKTLSGLPTSGMRVARSKLRNVLLQAAALHGDITWGVSCTEVLVNPKTGYRLKLSNGNEESCDILVVADGANSKLRSIIRPADKLSFAGAVSISAVSHFSGPPPEPVDRDWGIVTSGRGTALFVAPMDKESANWSVSYLADKPRKELRQPLSPKMNEALFHEAKTRGSMFEEPFQTLVDSSDPDSLMVFNAMDKPAFPHGLKNALPSGIIFIGDSNHAVSAFAGNGANLALMDGFDLAECFCSNDCVEKAVEAYDKRSMPRATAALETSHSSISLVHANGVKGIIINLSFSLLGYFTSLWYKLCGSV